MIINKYKNPCCTLKNFWVDENKAQLNLAFQKQIASDKGRHIGTNMKVNNK